MVGAEQPAGEAVCDNVKQEIGVPELLHGLEDATEHSVFCLAQ